MERILDQNLDNCNSEIKQEVVETPDENESFMNECLDIKTELDATPSGLTVELHEINSLKVITNFCPNYQKLEIGISKQECVPKNVKRRKIAGNVDVKQEIEKPDQTESDWEESISLLELIKHRKRKSAPKENPKIKSKRSNKSQKEQKPKAKDAKKLNSESDESDGLKEFLNAVESVKPKYKPKRKHQRTKEQQAEIDRAKLERRTCTICSAVFRFPDGLRNHIRSKHTFEKPYSCNICGEKFSTRSSCSIHRRRHLGIKPYLCNLCGKNFLQRASMHSHMKTHIPSEDKIRDVKCSFCCNVYTSKLNLNKHMLTKHTDPSDWKHECDICNKKCFSTADLTDHMRRHNDDRKYKCVICGRGFFTKQNMNVHFRTHSASTIFNCELCSNGYRSNEALQRHMLKVHSIGEEKPVSAPTHFCPVCEKGFRQRARLEKHLSLHETGEEEYPFECKECDKRYKARNYFTIHMLDKHNVFIDDDYFKTHFNKKETFESFDNA